MTDNGGNANSTAQGSLPQSADLARITSQHSTRNAADSQQRPATLRQQRRRGTLTRSSGGGSITSPVLANANPLTRAPSHQEVYNAETGSTHGEFGGHSSSHNAFQQYEKQDAREEADAKRVLEDVQSGHSGETEVERQEERDEEETQKQEQQRKGSVTPATSSATTSNTTNDVAYQGGGSGDTTTKDLEKQLTSEKQKDDGEEHDDEDLVTWDSPDSMENPRNWSLHRRWAVIATVSSYTFLSPLSSSMIAPALPLISQQFNITSTVEQSLMLSVFVLAYAVGPMMLGPLSELYGRRVVLQTSNAFFIIFTVACAVAQDRVQLSIFRFFAGLGGSAPLSTGGGTVSDLMNADERGTAIAVYSLGPLLGPAIGPIIGGWIVQRTSNWRWIFGVASIAAGVTAAIGLIILPETYAPRILGQKAARLRKETGNLKLHTIFERKKMTTIQRLEHNLVRPFVLLGTQPIIIVLAIYMMIMYGTMYLVLTTFESVFRTVYHESVGIASLNYISLAIGFTAAGQIGGRMADFMYKRLRSRSPDGIGRPEFKLPVMMSTCWCLPAGLLIYGWSSEYAVHWIVPNIGAVFMAIGMLTNFQCMQMYIVDAYTLYAASAIASVVFLRSLAGFALPLAGPTMYQNLGYGWGNTVLAFIAGAVGIPAPFLLFKFGPRLRAMSKYAATPTN